MSRKAVIPTKDHNKGLLESDKSSEDHSTHSAIAERSATCIGGDVELSELNKLGKEKENNDNSDGVVVKGIRRRDNYLPVEQERGTAARSNKIAVQKEVSLFDFALSFVPKGDEWRSQRRYAFSLSHFLSPPLLNSTPPLPTDHLTLIRHLPPNQPASPPVILPKAFTLCSTAISPRATRRQRGSARGFNSASNDPLS